MFENNPLTTICSLVYNHKKQCERNCILNKKGTPIQFSVIENYISNAYAPKMVKGPRNVIVSTTTHLEVNKSGLLVADEYGNTSRMGIFASGDVVNGTRTVVEAVAHSKVVAETMHKYILELNADN